MESGTKGPISGIEMEIGALPRKLTPEDRRRERIRQVSSDLSAGRRVTDFRFDQVYPPEIRRISETHWTPVEVVIRATRLLAGDSGTRVLDVGSGCGKFCIVGALAGPGQFVGVEQRRHLLEIGRTAARELEATRVSFLLGNMVDLDWSLFDAFYFFNPFYEHRARSLRIDATIPHGPKTFDRYVETVRTKLKAARAGTRVATYHGFGGEMPSGFQLIHQEPIDTSHLKIWVKMPTPAGCLDRDE